LLYFVQFNLGVYDSPCAYRDKKVGVFVRFRAPLLFTIILSNQLVDQLESEGTMALL
jgi:hypothetical protein